MIDLSTTYMGLKLKNPLVPSASPLTKDIDSLKRLEDAGAGAVVLCSLFEEQIFVEQHGLQNDLNRGIDSFPEALSYFPEPDVLNLASDKYYQLIQKAKQTLTIPVFGSLNGTSMGGWTDCAKQMEQAGADGLELNIYNIPTDFITPSEVYEMMNLEMFRLVKNTVNIPTAVKLSPFFTNMSYTARRFSELGAASLVLFNRFYQPDFDIQNKEVSPTAVLSGPQDLRLPLTWIAILKGHVKCSLAATSGVLNETDVLKAIMAGADITQLCSTLLRNGIPHLTNIRKNMTSWMEENEYQSVEEMKGCMSQQKCEDPSAFERAHYIRTLTGYKNINDSFEI
jgi:dihydroorotate dehydrogenase (fumarate)